MQQNTSTTQHTSTHTDAWNSLPEHLVNATSTTSIKNKNDKHKTQMIIEAVKPVDFIGKR